MIRKGEPWGHPAGAEADLEVHGDDAALAASLESGSGRLVRFEPAPASDLARALGLAVHGPRATEVGLDVLAVTTPGQSWRAVNAVVLGQRPDRLRAWHRRVDVVVQIDGRERFAGRATTVIVANGQYLNGLDVVPRGHPGDGRVEVQAYTMEPAQRAGMRRRLPQGAHVPHPGIVQATGRRVAVHSDTGLALEIDGRPLGRVRDVTVEVLPAALRLLI